MAAKIKVIFELILLFDETLGPILILLSISLFVVCAGSYFRTGLEIDYSKPKLIR